MSGSAAAGEVLDFASEAPSELVAATGRFAALTSGSPPPDREPSAGSTSAELDLLYRISATGLALLDRELRYLRVNPRLAAMNGVAVEAHLGRTVREVVPRLAEALEPVLRRALKTGEPIFGHSFRHETASADGAVGSWIEDVHPIKDSDGAVRALLLSVREAFAARAGEARGDLWLAAIVESADDAIVSKTLDGVVTSWNPAAQRLFGYAADEMVGRHISVLAAPGREDEMPAILERLRRGEKIDHYETVRRRKDGHRVEVSLTISPIFDHDGRIIGASKIGRDISERKRAEAALQASEERFRAFANAMPDIVWIADPDGAVTFVNDRWLEFCGITPERNGRGWPQLVLHPDDRARCLERWTCALADGTDYEIEVRHRRHDGDYRWFLTRAMPVRDAEGRITAWFGSTTDIHDRKQAEEHQRRLAAELSHRVKNTLAVVKALVERTGANATSVPGFLEAFSGRIQALGAAHQALMASDWRGARLAEIIEAAVAPYLDEGTRIGREVQDTSLPPDVALTLALALHELATNAAKYGALSNERGRITIAAHTVATAGAPELRLTWQEQNGPAVRPPETQGFGTTMLSQAIAYQHHGQVELQWREEGLVCTLSLPLVEPDRPAREA